MVRFGVGGYEWSHTYTCIYIYGNTYHMSHIHIPNHTFFAKLGMCPITLCLPYGMSGGERHVPWLTHTNAFLIFPERAFGGKNYINGSLDAPRRDTSIAVVGIANRSRIKKLIFRVLVIKSTKNALTSAPSPFVPFWNDGANMGYDPFDSQRDGLQSASNLSNILT